MLDVAECLDDLRYCEWDALEHHLALADWPALTRRRFVVAVRALRAASPPDSAGETLAYAWADAAEGGDEAFAPDAEGASQASSRGRRVPQQVVDVLLPTALPGEVGSVPDSAGLEQTSSVPFLQRHGEAGVPRVEE